MKKLVFFLATIMLCINCKKGNNNNDCYQYDATCETIDISDTIDPVCGCDGVTYQNAGYAKCVGHVSSFTKGACK